MSSLRRAALLAPAMVLLAGLVGCGQEAPEPRAAPTPDRAAVECRAEWRELGEELAGSDGETLPSALAPRWTNLLATVDYYTATAEKEDCESTLTEQRSAVTALRAFSVSLQRWDAEYQLERVEGPALTYSSGPRPPAPTGKGRDQARAPKPAEVARALTLLRTQAPLATQEQGPAWQQARVTDLEDPKAVAKARKDLAFLSEESAAYRKARTALTLIQRALDAS